LGEIRLGEMGLGEMGQNRLWHYNILVYLPVSLNTAPPPNVGLFPMKNDRVDVL